MKKISFAVFVFCLLLFPWRIASAWFEFPTNPIYNPVNIAEKAYYPSIFKIGPNDYRAWYQSNSTPSNSTVAYATSTNGKAWTLVTNSVNGLITDNAGHPHVEFVDNKFRIWYWNTATPYGNNAMHYAESLDGITWTNDQSITGNLIATTSGQWNSGSYGATDVIINDNPTNVGANPFDYKYAMYYDATSGGYEQIALGYSADGINWKLYGTGPVLPKGPAGSWDSGYATVGTVIKGDIWTIWYSGGISGSNEGIGCATSNDGLAWTKCAANPVMSKNDGVTWRNNRTYTPSVIRDGGIDKMWFTGKDNAIGDYAIGYAILGAPGNIGLNETSDGGVSLPDGTSDLVLDDATALNISNSANTVNNGAVVVGGVTKTLANFIGGDLAGVDLSVPQTIGGQSVIIGKAIKISSGLNGIPIAITNPTLSNIHVAIPDNTTILASGEWDGTILPPKLGSLSDDTPPSGFLIGDTVIDIGSPNAALLFDKPVQVTLSGITGIVGYRSVGSTAWKIITTVCGGDYTTPVLPGAAFPGECSITNGIDTKILTYHFTTFGGLIANNFAVLAGSTITNTGASIVNGDLGLNPGSAVTGFPPGIINGARHVADSAAIQAQISLATAYNEAALKTPVSTVPSELGGTIKTSGVYDSADGTFKITGALTLDAQGDPGAVFIFKTASTLVTAASSSVVLVNGAQACNVFWQVGSSATLGASSIFKGNIMALTSVTVTTGASINGSVLARNGAVTLDANTITKAICADPDSSATLHTIKLVVNDNGGQAVPSNFNIYVKSSNVNVANSPAAGTAMPGTPHILSAGAYVISEDANSSYTQNFSGDCDAGGRVTLYPGDDKFCLITNDDIAPAAITTVGYGGGLYSAPAPPLIDVVKIPSPLSLPDGPGLVKYTYTLRNIGTVPVSDITMSDDICGSVALISGDTNTNAKLEVEETWVYQCSQKLVETRTNIAIAAGRANGMSTIDVTSATVVVGAPIMPPLIHVVKTPNLLKLPAGGGTVIYTYKVTNLGTIPLSNITLTDDKCSSIKYVSGDINYDYQLAPDEIFTYTCQTKLTKTTVNTAKVSGIAGNLTARDFAITTVVIAAIPAFDQQAKTIKTNLRMGSRNNRVAILQNFLILQNKGSAAQALAKVGATGYFGVLTRAALAEFQAQAGIKPALGYFGPITRSYLKLNF